jgi:hypothetical protein
LSHRFSSLLWEKILPPEAGASLALWVVRILGRTSVRYREEDLKRAFFSTRFSRTLDSLGYARFKHWRIYGEEGLARREAALWLGNNGLSVEYEGQTLSRYDVSFSFGKKKLKEVTNPQLFVSRHRPSQLKLFALEEMLGENGWLKALRLEEYAARTRHHTQGLQQEEVLFSYLDPL